jgi:hypothetical protein
MRALIDARHVLSLTLAWIVGVTGSRMATPSSTASCPCGCRPSARKERGARIAVLVRAVRPAGSRFAATRSQALSRA